MLPRVRSGLLGGTFDPPHIAHLMAGEAAYRQLGLDRVIFMPAGSPWQKADRTVSPAQHRWAMTSLATNGVDYFVADDREVHRQGWTYTVDTLDTFTVDEEIVLILGADAARGLPTWERSNDILARADVAVVPRPGVAIEEVNKAVGTANWLDLPALEISGTAIRQRAATGLGIRFMVAEDVYRYIVQEGLYKAQTHDP